jgi:hypothetical protein
LQCQLPHSPIEEDSSIEVLKEEEEEEEEAAANSLLTETQPGICPYRKASCSSTPVAEDASHLPEAFSVPNPKEAAGEDLIPMLLLRARTTLVVAAIPKTKIFFQTST